MLAKFQIRYKQNYQNTDVEINRERLQVRIKRVDVGEDLPTRFIDGLVSLNHKGEILFDHRDLGVIRPGGSTNAQICDASQCKKVSI